MRFIVLDTNVLAGALIKPDGPHAAVIRRVFGYQQRFSVVYSSQMMAEYRDVLGRSFITMRGLAEEAEALIDVFEAFGNEIVPKFVPAIVYPDYDDKPFLEAAIYTDGILVTNNVRDFPFLGVHIVRAEEFLDLVDLL